MWSQIKNEWCDYLQIILNNHNRWVRKGLENLVESPPVMPGDFVVTLKLLVLWLHSNIWQVRLFQMSYFVPIRANNLGGFRVPTVLTHYDWVKLCWRSVLQEFVQAAPHRDPVTGDNQDRNDRLRGDDDLWPISVWCLPLWMMILDLQQDFSLPFKLCFERVCDSQHISHHIIGRPYSRSFLLFARFTQLAGQGSAPQQKDQYGVPGDKQERATKDDRASLAEHGTVTQREGGGFKRTGSE